MAALKPFRVHFEDGTKLDVPAPDPKAAAELAKRDHDGIVRKTKLIKEGA